MIRKRKNNFLCSRNKKIQLEQTARSFYASEHAYLRQAAISYGVNYITLYHGVVKRGGEFQGSGNFTSQMTPN